MVLDIKTCINPNVPRYNQRLILAESNEREEEITKRINHKEVTCCDKANIAVKGATIKNENHGE